MAGGPQRAALETLQAQDPSIESIVFTSKFVVAYLLQQDGPSPGWRKANIEGPVYLVRRRIFPKFQLLVKSQHDLLDRTNDLLDSLHPEWELDCQKNYIFYKVEDTSKRIRGLWFHDDAERMRVEQALEKVVNELKEEEETSKIDASSHAPLQAKAGGGMQQLPATRVSKAALSTAFHSLADEDHFVNMVFMKLKDMEGRK